MINKREHGTNWVLLGCAVVGALIFLYAYGTAVLDPTNDEWILSSYIETDITQRYAGWLAYRQSDVFFPLTYSGSISYPFGDRASLADGIPLFMVFFKLLDPVLPQTFQFCGILCLLNLILQGVTGGMLVQLYTRSKLCIFIGGSLFCLSPVLLERLFRHTSLSFHWLILLAIWLYIQLHRGGSSGLLLAFAAVCVGSVWIHLYFTPMVIGFFAVAVADCFIVKKGSFWHIASFVAAVALCVASGLALGLFGMGLDNTVGYGTMGMNLNALFNPVSLGPAWWVPGMGKIDWSAFLPMRALTQNNIESFNYLGCGVLIGASAVGLLCVVVFLKSCHKKSLRKDMSPVFLWMKEHLALIAFLIFSTFFAISNTVCAFSYVVFSVTLPDAIQHLFSAFRASGRLFWSVNYVLVLGVIVFVIRFLEKRKHWMCIALGCILLIQVVDLYPVMQYKRSYAQEIQSWSGRAQAEEVLAVIGDNEVLYNLELRDDRAMCTALLKEGISNNYWLISRENYMVEELQQDMEKTKQALLRGEKVYDRCVYSTKDAALAQEILLAAPWLTEAAIADVYYLWEAER